MNALKANNSGCIKPALQCTLPFCAVDLSSLDEDSNAIDSDDDEASLDNLSIITESCSSHSPKDNHSGTNGIDHNVHSNNSYQQDTPTEEVSSATIKYAQDFLKSYLCGSEQPTAVLQQRYAKFQHEQNKQSQTKSVKPWFRYAQRFGASKDLWWTADVTVPNEVAKDWGLDTQGNAPLIIASGHLPLSLKEWEMAEVAVSRNDMLHILFGEYKHCDEKGQTLWFKSKTAAQKSATLNLLFLLGGHKSSVESTVEQDHSQGNNSEAKMTVAPKEYPNWVNRLYALGFGGHSSRYTLHSIKHRAASRDPNGPLLSSNNPCIITCTLKYTDNDSESSGETISVASGEHFAKEHAFEDMLRSIELQLQSSSSCPNPVIEAQEKDEITKTYDSTINYEKALPQWSTSEIGSKAFLYELKFHTRSPDSRDGVPFAHTYGLNAFESTKIGLLTGCDVFGDLDETQKLSAEFTIPGSNVSNGPITATICNRTCIDTEKLKTQVSNDGRNGYKIDPVTLLKCFNAIIFANGGRTYGLNPSKSPQDILSELRKKSYDDRTYMLLPLKSNVLADDQELCIDWNVILDVLSNESTPALQRFNINPLCYVVILCALMSSLAFEKAADFFESNDSLDTAIEASCMCIEDNSDFVLRMVAASMFIILAIIDKYLPPRRMARSILSNRFIKQPLGFRGSLFVLDTKEINTSLIAASPLVDIISSISIESKEFFYNRYKLGFDQATYASYHIHWAKWKFGEEKFKSEMYHRLGQPMLRYPHESLIKACKVLSHAGHDFTLSGLVLKSNSTPNSTQSSIAQILAEHGYLVPELVKVLPMPRDLLYLAQHSCHFMSSLERAHVMEVATIRLLSIKYNVHRDAPIPCPSAVVSMLKKATLLDGKSTTIREHERLESLGDVVLMFLIVINMFASLSSHNDNVLEVYESGLKNLGRNVVLDRGAMALGLHRLVFDAANSRASWDSLYRTQVNTDSDGTKQSSMKRLSNTLESLLGGLFTTDKSGTMATGILNEISPCLNATENEIRAGSSLWFTSLSTCMIAGYKFERDSLWTSSLNQINKILQKESSVFTILKCGAEALLDILLKHSGCHDLIHKIKSQRFSLLLVHAALFDDSLDEANGDGELTGLECLAILRDKIFHVGNATLYLSLVNEIYHQYPGATSGDIHFAKLSVLSDDTLAYVLVKNGLHKCLFDKDSDATSSFTQYMDAAEALAEEFWKRHNGWIVSGGVEEFHRRVQARRNGNNTINGPCYSGLAAGRLFGEKRAVSKDITGELMFSIKAIVGALCLSIGLKDAWALVRPLFLELLLLSPDETRKAFAHVSDLAAKSKKGCH